MQNKWYTIKHLGLKDYHKEILLNRKWHKHTSPIIAEIREDFPDPM